MRAAAHAGAVGTPAPPPYHAPVEAVERVEIAIVGGGLAGALLACLLGRAGREVALYERRPDPRVKGFAGGRSINLALSARGIEALRRAGLADQVLAEAIPMPGRMIHAPSGRLVFQPYSKDRSDAINSVSRGGLNLAMLEAAEAISGVRVHFGQRCADVELEAPALLLEGGEPGETRRVEASLVIGADGAFSAVRGRLQRLERFDYSQSFLSHGYKELCIPPAPGGRFAMEPRALHIWPRGRFMMIALPNRDGSFTATLFWPWSGPGGFESIRTGPDLLRFFEESFPDALPLMPTLAGDYFDNPTGSMVTVRCGPWHHEDRVVLVGDAAHAVVPFYGQGMNAAFEDCAALAELLARHDRLEALRRYYAMRKENADAIADLALANFIEMRDHTASGMFRARKRAERVLHRLLPFWYTPLYNMVSFTCIPYAEARRRAARQGRIVALSAAGACLVLVALAALLLRRLLAA
jgi:kynurenine 3-monooxygenase